MLNTFVTGIILQYYIFIEYGYATQDLNSIWIKLKVLLRIMIVLFSLSSVLTWFQQ